jgi:hypothetical protein
MIHIQPTRGHSVTTVSTTVMEYLIFKNKNHREVGGQCCGATYATARIGVPAVENLD